MLCGLARSCEPRARPTPFRYREGAWLNGRGRGLVPVRAWPVAEAAPMAEERVSRWYFGGLASSGAACCTHPLDLLVHLQTQQEVKMRMMGMAMHVIRTDGFLALYNGLSASLCRQMTYSLTRFGIYESGKKHLGQGSQGPPPFYQKVLLGATGGLVGGFVGTPADMVNVRALDLCMVAFGVVGGAGVLLTSLLASLPHAVCDPQGEWDGRRLSWPFCKRATQLHCPVLGSPVLQGQWGTGSPLTCRALPSRMQNDMKQPPSQRRNYAHALDGMYRVFREEGVKKLFAGASVASSRGAFVTVGQLSCYDQAKQLVLATGLMSDNVFAHFLSSFIAGICATFLCQPLDVLKTRLMNSHGEYRGVIHCAMETAKLGPLAFYKGFVPAAVRLVPQTVLTFIFLEQLRKYFGIKVTT
ncbi:hypothetical protein Nmel_016442 [Mimus melanotis]